MLIVLRQLIRTGFRRGITHGSRTWLVTGIVAYTVNLLIRAARADAEVVKIHKLRPGDRFVVSIEPRRKQSPY